MTISAEKLFLGTDVTVTCPKCEHEFSLEQGFAKKALERLSETSSGAIKDLEESVRVEALKSAARESAEQARLAQAKLAADRQALEQRLQERDRQVAELRAAELMLRREKSAVEDRAAALEIEVARKLDAGRAEIEARARAQEQERTALEKAEMQKKLDDVSSQLVDAQRRMAQGSQQLQGEVLELAIEEGLRRAFPLDSIEEVKKGQRGGDVLQQVMTRSGQAAGTILWETKRAKDWSAQWIPKLKEDMRGCGAAVGILVTMPEALPKDWPRSAYFALREGVWVTQASCAVAIAEVLRMGLIDLQRQRQASAGKNEKMEALYDYLTSPQFAQKLAAVFDSFKRMREELESEKNQTTQRWARREKQLQLGMNQLLGVGGEIQGLSQQDVPVLELEAPPSGDEAEVG
jgi:hypothetical protein